MKTLATRLAWAREQKKLSQAELAKKSGVSQSTIGNLEAGIRLTARSITAIATALGVNPVWLAEGKGIAESTDGQVSSIKNVTASSIGVRRIPLISYVQAGCMVEVVDPYQLGDASEYLQTDLVDLSPSAFALEIRGESMLPDFKEGDRIIIDPLIEPMPGDFVVAKNGHEEATFKKYRPRGKFDENGNTVFDLLPLNPDYPPMHSDIVPLRIIGTMVEHRRYRKK